MNIFNQSTGTLICPNISHDPAAEIFFYGLSQFHGLEYTSTVLQKNGTTYQTLENSLTLDLSKPDCFRVRPDTMSLDDGSTLLSLAHTISILTSQVHAYLKETAQPEPSFSPSSVEIDTNSTFEELRSSLTDATNDLLQLVNGPKRTLRTLYGTHYDLAANQVALEFDFFALIPVNGTSTVKQLAEATKLNPDIVARVLRILTTQHIFLEVEDGVFMHTAASATIARDEDLKASFAMQMDEVFQAASVTATSLKTNSGKLEAGTCPFSERFGVPIFGYYKEKPEKGERFGKAMAGAQKCL